MNRRLFFVIPFFILLFTIQIINFQSGNAETEDVQKLLEDASDKIKNQEYKSALEILEHVLEIDSENKFALRNTGAILNILERFEEAYQINNEYYKKYPDDLDAYNNVGVSLVKMEKYNEALDIFQDIIKNNNDYLAAIENRRVVIELMDLERIESSKYLVFVQIEIRDSNGMLVGFFESHRITHLPYHPIIDKYLNSQKIETIEIINETKYEIWKINQIVINKYVTFIGNTVLQTPDTVPHFTMFSATYHGYVLDIDDQVSVLWTIARPLE